MIRRPFCILIDLKMRLIVCLLVGVEIVGSFLERQQSSRLQFLSFHQAKQMNSSASDANSNSELCVYVLNALKAARAVKDWPLSDCHLPNWLHIAKPGEKNVVSLALVNDAMQVEQVWASALPGTIVIVKVQGLPGDRDVVWQSLYQSQSRLYFKECCAGMTEEDLGLPGLQFAGFVKGHIVLQKAQYESDIQNSYGEFYTLAKKFGTDKIGTAHNYSLLYHRHLDVASKKAKGAMVEVGLGCTMKYGPGASAQIWPRMFPQLQVHFIEVDRKCTEKWLPQMQNSGIKKVHIGSQDDLSVLNEVIEDVTAVPGGLRIVIDDGSHECDHMHKTFRFLYKTLADGGLYFVEDLMYSSWGTRLRKKIYHKYQTTKGTMIAVAAEHAIAAIGFPSSDMLAAKTRLVECTPGHCVFKRK